MRNAELAQSMNTRRDIQKQILIISEKNATLIKENNMKDFQLVIANDKIQSLKAKLLGKTERCDDQDDEIKHLYLKNKECEECKRQSKKLD